MEDRGKGRAHQGLLYEQGQGPSQRQRQERRSPRLEGYGQASPLQEVMRSKQKRLVSFWVRPKRLLLKKPKDAWKVNQNDLGYVIRPLLRRKGS